MTICLLACVRYGTAQPCCAVEAAGVPRAGPLRYVIAASLAFGLQEQAAQDRYDAPLVQGVC